MIVLVIGDREQDGSIREFHDIAAGDGFGARRQAVHHPGGDPATAAVAGSVNVWVSVAVFVADVGLEQMDSEKNRSVRDGAGIKLASEQRNRFRTGPGAPAVARAELE